MIKLKTRFARKFRKNQPNKTPRKAQAALEYLFTYGWAFMVILVMIGAFAYLGFTNPIKYVPDKCFVSDGMYCRSALFAQSAQDSTEYDLFILLENPTDKSALFFLAEDHFSEPIANCQFTIAPNNGFKRYSYDPIAGPGTDERLKQEIDPPEHWLEPKASVLLGVRLIGCNSIPEKITTTFQITYREERTSFNKTLVGEIVTTPQSYQNHIRNLP
jgi:hypothetical protein